MTVVSLINADVIEWAKSYSGESFHALLCDPPYHMTSIVKRFGKPGSAPAKYGKDGVFQRASRGFMGQKWDGGDIAFDPETWYLIGRHLYPGAFGMAYASARGWHRVACAIEDAGFIIHPTIFVWVYGSGFPKATNISKQIDKRAGAERRVVGKRTVSNDIRSGNYKKNSATPLEVDITLPATELAKTWEGHRYSKQALKPAAEPIIVFQKPYDGKALDNITQTGAGALNIDGARIGRQVDDRFEYGVSGDEKSHTGDENTACYGEYKREAYEAHSDGRWPAQFILQHNPECDQIDMISGDGYVINRFTDGAKPFGGGAGHEYRSKNVGEMIPVWECSEDCPAKKLEEQNKGSSRYFFQSHWGYEVFEQIVNSDPAYYQAKASRKERDAGLDEKNPHPTVKPISLLRYLATLLLPPSAYAPRRILVPFAGVASEMIGACFAGWDDVIGIELKADYCEIGYKRLKFWASQDNGFVLDEPTEKEMWDW